MTLCEPNYLPQAPSPNTNILGVMFPYENIEGLKHSVSSRAGIAGTTQISLSLPLCHLSTWSLSQWEMKEREGSQMSCMWCHFHHTDSARQTFLQMCYAEHRAIVRDQHGTSDGEILPCCLYRKEQSLCFHFYGFLILKEQCKGKVLLIPADVWKKFS